MAEHAGAPLYGEPAGADHLGPDGQDLLRWASGEAAGLVSLASHELRTPLTAIKALAGMLASQHAEGRPLRTDFLPLLDEETDRLTRMLDALAVLGRAESGRLAWEWSGLHVNEAVDEAVEVLRTPLARRGLDAAVATDPPPPVVRGDRPRLVQALAGCIELVATWCEGPGALLVWAAPPVGAPAGAELVVLGGPATRVDDLRQLAAGGGSPDELMWGPGPAQLATRNLLGLSAQFVFAAHGGDLRAVRLADVAGFWGSIRSPDTQPTPAILRRVEEQHGPNTDLGRG